LIGLKGDLPNHLLVENLGVKSKKIVISAILLLAISVALCVGLGSTLSNSQASNTPPISVVYGEEEAVKIALPLVQAYAQENNRTLTTTKTILRETDRPYWFIEIELKTAENPDFKYHLQTTSYEVAVWVDTGEIRHHGSIWIDTHGLLWLNNSPTASYCEDDFKISLDKAIEIAYLFAQTYAQENNRTLTTVDSYAGYADSRPTYSIDIRFEAIKDEDVDLYSYEQYGTTTPLNLIVVYNRV